MAEENSVIPVEAIQGNILVIQGQRVILDSDLARLYGCKTSRLNEQVKRNARRFPRDFVFQLGAEELENLMSQNAISSWGGRRRPPFAFTEHGAIMAATVLNTEQAVKVSVLVVRAFVKLRELTATHHQLAAKIDELEKRVDLHDDSILRILETIRLLMEQPPEPVRKPIGFQSEQEGM